MLKKKFYTRVQEIYETTSGDEQDQAFMELDANWTLGHSYRNGLSSHLNKCSYTLFLMWIINFLLCGFCGLLFGEHGSLYVLAPIVIYAATFFVLTSVWLCDYEEVLHKITWLEVGLWTRGNPKV